VVGARDLEIRGTATKGRIRILVAVVVAGTIATVATARGFVVRCGQVGVKDKLDGGVASDCIVKAVEGVCGEAVHIHTDPERRLTSSPPRLKAQRVLKQVMRAQIGIKIEDTQIGRRTQKIAKHIVLCDLLDARKEAMGPDVRANPARNLAPRDLGASGETEERAERIRDRVGRVGEAGGFADAQRGPDVKVALRLINRRGRMNDADMGRHLERSVGSSEFRTGHYLTRT